jgi:hypothetical protein
MTGRKRAHTDLRGGDQRWSSLPLHLIAKVLFLCGYRARSLHPMGRNPPNFSNTGLSISPQLFFVLIPVLLDGK